MIKFDQYLPFLSTLKLILIFWPSTFTSSILSNFQAFSKRFAPEQPWWPIALSVYKPLLLANIFLLIFIGFC